MRLTEVPLTTIDGTRTSLAEYGDRAILIVNVASKCGMTPQYAQLEELQQRYADRGFTVLGVPCNQFMGQEPGSSEDIQTFCAVNYGVTFPMLEKTKVNGRHSHALYRILRETNDAAGRSGRVRWNFEKFLVAPGGEISRFRSAVEPTDPAVIAAIEAALPR
ncbi:Glutathione peroxidase family protein [Leucobacter sp. 7(1)]|uniref:glutathione peroxidase n=1 Tax=Leucobacter sp. 7(1) TaxID=1255613 RepID=UPI00097F0758|nr:glutathione peroxidase [Leucobacter sp. 7(1)]SJN08202.1 Glutathione peroxidase family protein [Leucobacter sp. 7(1)]